MGTAHQSVKKMNDDNSQLVATSKQGEDKGGRPRKDNPETVERLLEAIMDGLTIRQGCLAAGIGETTLGRWREEHPDLQSRMEEARETARQKSLASIKAAGSRDWKAHEAWLRLSFQADYRQPNTKIDVNTNAQAGAVIITDEKRNELQDKFEQWQKRSQNGNG